MLGKSQLAESFRCARFGPAGDSHSHPGDTHGRRSSDPSMPQPPPRSPMQASAGGGGADSGSIMGSMVSSGAGPVKEDIEDVARIGFEVREGVDRSNLSSSSFTAQDPRD